MTDSLAPLRRFFHRDRARPSVIDFEKAGLCLGADGLAVCRGDDWLGAAEEFGIVGTAFDKKSETILHGRFLIQSPPEAGEVLHHIYYTRGIP